MPVRKVRDGWRWGRHGKVYPTEAQAEEQGRAAYASGYRGGGRRKPSRRFKAGRKPGR